MAWQLARAFKLEVYRILVSVPAAGPDLRYADQLRGAAASVSANIGEGFHRFGAREFARYLLIALSSLGEAEHWLQDGVDRGHFSDETCTEARQLAKRCRVATARLRRALDQMANSAQRPPPRRRTR